MESRRNSESKRLRDIAADFDRHFRGVDRVSQLMLSQKGREWWKKYGGSFDADFGLTSGGHSRQVLSRYIAEKAARSKKKSLMESPQTSVATTANLGDSNRPVPDVHHDSMNWYSEDGLGIEQPDPLTPEDEMILDKIWDEIARESGFGGDVDSKVQHS